MLSIVRLGESVLTKRASVIPEIDRTIRDLASAMLEAMNAERGLGLAGPQVGELKRLFVTHVESDGPRVFINPQIILTSNETVSLEEGCLSIPGIYADVVRPVEITIQAWNERGRPFTLEADGMLARVAQHENDHLNGILFLDHLEEKKRLRLVKMFEKRQDAAAVT